jgi:hypothetical protein
VRKKGYISRLRKVIGEESLGETGGDSSMGADVSQVDF